MIPSVLTKAVTIILHRWYGVLWVKSFYDFVQHIFYSYAQDVQTVLL